MRRIYGTLIIFLLNVLFLFSLPSMPGMCADPDKTEPVDVKKMEETIRKQEEQLKQLQSELNQLRDKSSTTTAQQPPSIETLSELALRESWGGGVTDSREVRITDGVVSIKFNNLQDLIAFFDSGAEEHARSDLAVFLKQSGLERGTIEYASAERRLYSITGSLTASKTTQYY